MNIIVTTDGNIPSKKAHSFSVMKMAQGFHQVGEQVSVVSLLSFPIMREFLNFKNIYDHYGVTDRIRIKLLPVFNWDFITKSTNAAGFHRRAIQYIRKKNPAFVYCRSYITAYNSVKAGIPAFLETHTTLYDHPDLVKIYDVCRYPNFLGLITIHANIKKEHVKRGIPEDKVIVLEDGVDLERFEISDKRDYWREMLGLPQNKKLVVYCGHLYDEKGIEHILRTAIELKAVPDVRFLIVGGNESDIGRWKRYCDQGKITNVMFKGFVDNFEVPKYLRSADVLIMPYKTDIDYQIMDIDSTSPLKLFEYMASKRPIVSSDIPAISKVLQHNHSALLAEPNNIAQIAKNVRDLLDNVEDANRLADNASEEVKKYEWMERCKKIISIYERYQVRVNRKNEFHLNAGNRTGDVHNERNI